MRIPGDNRSLLLRAWHALTFWWETTPEPSLNGARVGKPVALRTIEIDIDGMKKVLRLNLTTTYLEIPTVGRFKDSGRRTADGHEVWEREP